MADFEADTAVRAAGDGLYECEIYPAWWVVIGPNGGYIAAILVRALSADPALDGRPLRTLTVHYLRAPAEGPARVVVAADRHGRSVSFLRARLEQDGKVCARALAIFADDRDGFELERAPVPEGVAPPPENVDPDEPPHPLLPQFAHQFHYARRLGAEPFSGGEHALSGGWMRPRRDTPLDAALVVALMDAWSPAVYPAVEEPLAVPTLELTVHLRARLPRPAGWVLGRFETTLARHGFLEEDGALWSSDGILLAQSRQLAIAG